MNAAPGEGVLEDLKHRAVFLSFGRTRVEEGTPVAEIKDVFDLP